MTWRLRRYTSHVIRVSVAVGSSGIARIICVRKCTDLALALYISGAEGISCATYWTCLDYPDSSFTQFLFTVCLSLLLHLAHSLVMPILLHYVEIIRVNPFDSNLWHSCRLYRPRRSLARIISSIQTSDWLFVRCLIGSKLGMLHERLRVCVQDWCHLAFDENCVESFNFQ